MRDRLTLRQLQISIAVVTQSMMVRDRQFNSQLLRMQRLFNRRPATINGDNGFNIARAQIIKRLVVQSISLDHAVRYVRNRRWLHFQFTKQADQNRRGANSVGVVITVHGDAFALRDPTIQNPRHIVRAMQRARIVHQGQRRLRRGEQLRIALARKSATANHPLAQTSCRISSRRR